MLQKAELQLRSFNWSWPTLGEHLRRASVVLDYYRRFLDEVRKILNCNVHHGYAWKFYRYLISESLYSSLSPNRFNDFEESDYKRFVVLVDKARASSFRTFQNYLSQLADQSELPVDIVSSNEFRKIQVKELERLRKLVSKKSIALVGPAGYLIGLGKGKMIDSFDLVVRTNFQWPVSHGLKVDFGERGDILFHSCNGDYSFQQAPNFISELRNLRFVGAEYNILSKNLRQKCALYGVPFAYLPESVFKELTKTMGSFPSIGLASVQFLLSLPISSLSIFGMTMQTTPYAPTYLGRGVENSISRLWSSLRLPAIDRPWHNPSHQKTLLLTLSKRDPRVLIDPDALAAMS